MTKPTALVYPSGRISGCLLRKSKPGEWCPLAKERIRIIPREEWKDWEGKISLRSKCKKRFDQGAAGSCAMESAVQGGAISRCVSGLPFVLLNPYFGYHTTSGGRDQGSSIDENLVFLRKHGCASQAVWPRSKGWRAEPSEEAWEDAKQYKIDEFYDIANVDEMVSALLQGFPVVWGANGHAVCKVEHLNDREGLDANSWGEDWGDEGFGVWARYSQINWGYGAWAVKTTTVPDDSPDPPIPTGT